MTGTSVSFYNFTGDEREINKEIGNSLTTATVYLSENCSISNPDFTLPYDASYMTNYNYCYISDWGRYYYISNWETERGGKMRAYLIIDPLYTFRNDILKSDVTVIRSESAGMTHIVDNKYPLFPDLCNTNIKVLDNGTKTLERLSGYTILLGVL